jgi:hypothetical protein
MPSSNLPDPDKIPDMSLGERTERPASKPQPLEGASAYQHQPNLEPPRPVPQKPAGERERRWQEGDDVLAPWEPTFLYPGTIKQIMPDDARGDQALIAYDDGGEGWVFLYSLCPLEFKEEQQVHVRRQGGVTYVPGKILEVGDDEVRVRYDNGNTEWTRMTTLRVPCIANGPGAAATKLAPWQPATAPVGDSGTGIPSWVIWVGLAILLAVFRVGCRAAMQD